jgi:DNA-binding response OmpR family regulator
MASTVLIVEDDLDIARLVSLYLERDGHKVISAQDGIEGLKLARDASPDLVVLDLMLPKLSGIEICRTLRQESTVPVVMVTARVEEEDRLKGLDLGADDYVTKPFSPRELAARVRAVLRRTARDDAERGPVEVAHGGVKVDMHRRSVYVQGRKVSLTPTEFRILVMLIKEPERTFSREQIIDRVFGFDFDGFDRTVDAHIANIRRKIRPANGPDHIQTVYGVGYRFSND